MPHRILKLANLNEIDAQHQYLLTLAEAFPKLDGVCLASIDPRAMAELISYARYHFASEEALMVCYEYPGNAHRREHAMFLEHISSLVNEPRYHANAFRLLVRNWLSSHIDAHDVPLARYVANARHRTRHIVEASSGQFRTPRAPSFRPSLPRGLSK